MAKDQDLECIQAAVSFTFLHELTVELCNVQTASKTNLQTHLLFSAKMSFALIRNHLSLAPTTRSNRSRDNKTKEQFPGDLRLGVALSILVCHITDNLELTKQVLTLLAQ